MIERLFKLRENNTNVKTEVVSGLITFFSMSYILVVNPAVLSAAGIPLDRVFTATIIAVLVGTLIMALAANYPIVVAPGMGINSYFATLAATSGYNYKTLLATCFLGAVIFVILSATKFREILIDSIPNNLRYGISAAIGLFIAFLGLKNSALIVANPHTILSLGDLKNPVAYMTILGIFIILVLLALEVKGAIFIGMVVVAIISYFTGMLKVDKIFGIPHMDLSLLYNPVSESINALQLGLYGIVFTFLMVTLFDTTGTMVAVTTQAGLIKNGKMEKVKEALLADSFASLAGSLFGSTPTSAYIESSAGVANGGRTGLTALTTALMFLASIIFAPIVTIIPNAATSPALIFVGVLMLSNVKDIDFSDITDAVPAFCTIVFMPFTYSIANGIALGLITYCILKIFTGQGEKIKALTWVVSIIFILRYAFITLG